MPDTNEMRTMLTQIAVPIDLKARIESLAKLDRRTYKLEVITLLELGVTVREKQVTGK